MTVSSPIDREALVGHQLDQRRFVLLRVEPLMNGVQDGSVPRVLRLCDQPWGKTGLRPRELLQLRAANLLLGVATYLSALVVRSGGFVLGEHPAQSTHQRHSHLASRWRLPVTQAFLAHPQARLVTFDQGPLGQPHRKATSMITAASEDIPVIVLTMYREDQFIFDAIRAGARGYLLKDADADELLDAIQVVHRGEALNSWLLID